MVDYFRSLKKWFFLLLITFSISCSDLDRNANNLIVSGKVKSTSSGYIFLEKLGPKGYEKADSTNLNTDNSFSFRVPKGKAEVYRINFFGIQKNNIVLDSQDISIVADGNLMKGNFLVKGSPEVELLSKIYTASISYKLEENLSRQKFLNLNNQKDTTGLNALRKDYLEKESSFYGYLKRSVNYLNGHLAAWLILTKHFDIEQNLDFYADQITLFNSTIPGSWQLKQLNEQYQYIKKLAIGSVATDFSLPGTDGKLIQLSSFRGKYVFLDFRASWCQPCRLENPELMTVYNKFKGEHFEILGVSFDKKRENWLKAIEQDGLEWKHVSDLKYFDSEMIQLYNIVNVPTTIFLDPEGKIIAKNIHSRELEAILEERL